LHFVQGHSQLLVDALLHLHDRSPQKSAKSIHFQSFVQYLIDYAPSLSKPVQAKPVYQTSPYRVAKVGTFAWTSRNESKLIHDIVENISLRACLRSSKWVRKISPRYIEHARLCDSFSGTPSLRLLLYDSVSATQPLLRILTQARMESEGNSQNFEQGKKGTRRSWSKFEEDSFLTVLDDFVAAGQCCETGSFKSGTMVQMEKALNIKCPDSGLKACPSY
ncbi:hypothetical protein Prudu_1357S000900, partial [Prunus dulcis]